MGNQPVGFQKLPMPGAFGCSGSVPRCCCGVSWRSPGTKHGVLVCLSHDMMSMQDILRYYHLHTVLDGWIRRPGQFGKLPRVLHVPGSRNVTEYVPRSSGDLILRLPRLLRLKEPCRGLGRLPVLRISFQTEANLPRQRTGRAVAACSELGQGHQSF